MRITIDARMITYTGIGRYIQNLLAGFSKIKEGVAFSAIVNDASAYVPGSVSVRPCRTRRNIPVYSVREHLLLPFEVRRTRPDVVHYPSFNAPVTGFRPFVATIHDLIYYLNPAACPNMAAYLYARFVISSTVRRANKVITVSDFTKTELIAHLGVKPDKIRVIHNGVAPIYAPVTDELERSRVRRKYGVDGPYILYVGNHQERKNLVRLVKAYSALKNRKDVFLVLTGRPDPKREALYRTVRDLGLENSVRFIGDVAEDDLPALYSSAALFAFPSLMEGFGLPPLEAMACGTPVVTSDRTSLPEVVADAALVVNPQDTGAISDAMDSLLTDSALRQRLREKGMKRAAEFSWDSAVEATLDVYKEVYKG